MHDDIIYLDNHATTPCDPLVIEAMLPMFGECFGNPHSKSHSAGHLAHERMQAAIDVIARLLGTDASEIVLTSGATESNNLAILGHCLHPRNRRRHIITTAIEHPAVLDPIAQLERRGFRVTRLEVCGDGRIDLLQLADACSEETALVSVMLANNEIGTVEDLQSIAEIAHEHATPVHTDATQAVGRIPLDLSSLAVDLLSASAHKFYGPKGTGLLFVRRRNRLARLQPQFFGGGQQRAIRPGTMNPAGIIGMAKAFGLCRDRMETEHATCQQLRDRLFAGLRSRIPNLQLNGPSFGSGRLAGNLNVMFPGVEGQSLMLECPKLAVSSGSACSSVEPTPSHVLLGIGCNEEQARCSLRFGVGRFNTEKEIDQAIDQLSRAYHELRGTSGA